MAIRSDEVEILYGDGEMARRGKRMLEAMHGTMPGVKMSERYTGTRSILMMYGAGLDVRTDAMRQHLASGGRVVVWDLGYWDRDDHMRLAIDSLHPTADQLKAVAARETRRKHVLRSDFRADGPILLIGMGYKSTRLYGVRPMEWERQKLRDLQHRFPGQKILWRPKSKHIDVLPGTEPCHGVPIEVALRGVSLVVCRHSNVGVDACIAGVPVETEDGAALALYKDNHKPTSTQRKKFLDRLSWFNWAPREAPQAWEFISFMLEQKC